MELSLDPAADQPILTALRTGHHRRAARLMVTSYGPAVYTACRLVADAGEADDLTYTTMQSAFSSLGEFRAEGSPKAWLLGITRRCCADHVRQQISKSAVTSRDAELALAAQRCPDCVASVDLCREAVLGLDPVLRATVGLKASELFDDAASAEVLHVDEAAYRRLLLGALDIVSARLCAEGGALVARLSEEDPKEAYPQLLRAIAAIRWRPSAALSRRLDVLAAAL